MDLWRIVFETVLQQQNVKTPFRQEETMRAPHDFLPAEIPHIQPAFPK